MKENEVKTLEQLMKEVEQAKQAYENAKKLADAKEKEEAVKQAKKLAEEKDTRKKEVNDAIDRAIDLLTKYNEDYGSYSFSSYDIPWKFLF